MEQRSLEVTVLSAKDLNKVNLIGKMDVYVIISISGNNSKQKVKTPVDTDGGTNPAWNFQTKFIIDEAAAQQNHHALVFQVKCERALGDKDIGEVHVPIKELLQSPEAIDGKKQFVSYQVRKPDGKPKGFINFAYQFGEKVKKTEEQPAMAYPPPHGVGSTSAYPPPASVYPPPATGGVYYPPPPHSEGYPPPPNHSGGGYNQPPHHSEGYPPPPKHSEGGYHPPPHHSEGYPQYHGAPPPPQGGYHHPPPQYAGYGYQQPPPYGGHPPPPTSGYGYPPQSSYGYPPQQPGYGYAQPGQKPPKKNGKTGGLGLGAGLLGGALGGMLIGDMMTDGGLVDFDF